MCSFKICYWKNLLLFVLGFTVFTAGATEDPPITAILKGSQNALNPNTVMTELLDPISNNLVSPSPEDSLHKIKSAVYFMLDESDETGTYIQADFTATVNLEISYTTISTGANYVVNVPLTVTYKKDGGNVFDRMAYYSFEGAKRVSVKLASISSNVSWDYKKHLILKAEMVAVRDYKFECGDLPQNIQYTTPAALNPDELKVSWATTAGHHATEYELEWAWVDKWSADHYKVNNIWNNDLIFNGNASRVTIDISEVNYMIPLMYDEGFIFSRVRNIQTKESGQRIEGSWGYTSLPYECRGHMAETTAGQTILNWQSTISFAEEGKRKVVVQYADGTLRGRQTVTKDNSVKDIQNNLEVEGETVVAETIYDFQGRPAIQILPAPTLNTVIAYTRNFNTIVSGTAIRPVDFDEININNGEFMCNKQTPALNTATGAANYYSPQNPKVADGINKYIPDAEGYPYAETRYAADGRVAEQGGVGPDYRVGAAHSTKYYYGTPDQKELDALFGTDAGNASHYFKNLVRDANGQYSVSYVDMHGRTVATALAGSSPDNLLALDGASARSMTFNLLNEATNIVRDRTIESVKTLVVAENGAYDFSYNLGGLSLSLQNCGAQNVCYDCVYELEITIVNDCSTPGAPNNGAVVRKFNNISIPAPNTTCSTAAGFNVTFSETLAPGSYTITKRLTVVKDAQDSYRAAFLLSNTCKTLQEFTNYYTTLFSQQIGNCRPTCSECQQKIPATYAAFRSGFITQTGISTTDLALIEEELQQTYTSLKAQCDAICNGTEYIGDPLAEIRNRMKEDMRPGSGQYGQYLDQDGNIAYYKLYNILNPTLTKGPRYRKPLSENRGEGEYKDDAGLRDPINETLSGLNVEDFISSFQDSWLDNLLPYHPEYPLLRNAEMTPNMRESYKQDEYFRGIDKFSAAQSAFQCRPLDVDIFFNSVEPSLKELMRQKVEVLDKEPTNYGNGTLYYHNLWQKAWVFEICNKNGSFDYTCIDSAPVYPPTSAGSCPGDIDAVWQRFIQLYLQRKRDIVNCYMDPVCPDNGNTAVHITQQPFNGYFTETMPQAFTLLLQGYQPHFYKESDLKNGNATLEYYNSHASDINASNNEANYEISGNYTENCENYVDAWLLQLQACPTIRDMAEPAKTNLLNQITNRLKNLCIQYSNEEHPLGSSTGPGGTPSFRQIISEELATANIPLSAVCHPYLVDFPPPYDNYPQLINEEIITGEVDNCFCTKFSTIQTDRVSSGFNGTLLQYIEYKYGTLMTQGHLDSLISYCAGAYSTCKYLTNPIKIPPALSCNTGNNVCRSCTEIQNWTAAFTTEFGQGPFADPATDAQLEYNIAYERFMNSKTGFNKKWTEYTAFLASCTSAGIFTCNQLQTILQQFYATYGNQQTGNSCRELFVQFFNNATGLFLTFTDIMTLYKNNCGVLPDVCEPKLDCKSFNNIINAFYATYGQSIADGSVNCQNLFVQFFNNWFQASTPYTWAQIVQFYQTVCGKELKVCDKFNCTALQQVLNNYITVHGSAGWLTNPGNCTQLFTNFFNSAMGSSFTFQQLQTMYSNCSINLNICTPPSCETLTNLANSFVNASETEYESAAACNQAFVTFINNSLGLQLTASQVEQMYVMACGKGPGVCGTKSCDDIAAYVTAYLATNPPVYTTEADCWLNFTAYYNAQTSEGISVADLQKLYEDNCGYRPNVCSGSSTTYTSTQLNTVKNLFTSIHPTPAAEYGDSCQVEFARFFNQLMGVNYTYSNIDLVYQSVTGSALTVCGGIITQCQQIQNFRDSFALSYANKGLPQAACRDLFTVLYNRRFQPSNYQFWADLTTLYQNCGLTITSCPSGSIVADSTTLKGIVLAFKATYTDPGADCQPKFVGFYNLYMGTSYDWNGLQQLYTTVTGNIPEVCSSAGTGTTVTLRTIPNPPNTINPPLLCGLNTTLFPEVKVYESDPCAWITEMAVAYAEEKYQLYIDSLKGAFDAAYYQKCISAAATESFTVSTNTIKEYHYTLYYYDQAGNLTKTVPPAGVNLTKFSDATWSTQVKTAKQNDQTLTVTHSLVTKYRYNSLNQVVEQTSPDGGVSKFWYDRLGRLVFSQNAKQAGQNQYSYTKYDNLGRIDEVGQLTSATAMTQATSQSATATTAWWTTTVDNSREQITKTVYDVALTGLCTPAPSVLCQKNLRNRVSYSYVQPSATYSNNGNPYASATFYSYDIHGNVDVLLQHYNSGIMQTSAGGNAFKRIEYKYDLISGKVNEVAYQPGSSDQFFHRYSYDAENKLTKVFTSPDRVVWEQEADYSYYRHGPLARVELGQVGVQGVDYAYTLQGWLKTVNSTAVTAATDMGGDGTLSGRKMAADVYGFALHYNSTDYKAINLSKTVVAPVTSTTLPAFKDLYNGNIAAMAVTFNHTSFGSAGNGLNQSLLYKYRYDQLNRIKEMDAYSGLNQSTNAWAFGSALTAYQERVSYDGNGNILTYTRNGDAARTAMDNMTYSYVSGTNKLDKVVDIAADASPANYPNYNDLKTGQATGNYGYDAIGNLIKDVSEGISSGGIVWNVYGKIESVTKNGVTTSYTYDASGNRISKTTSGKTTWYVRDASGNVMAVYENGNSLVNSGHLTQIEVHLYGSSRLGMWTPNRDVQVIPSAQTTAMTGITNGGTTTLYRRGQKLFELSNHLGNVLVTITDRKVAIQNGSTGTILNYVADVVSGSDYYPFGMLMPGRKYEAQSGYRYGFNGKEKDKDINSLTAYDYGFRIYNPGIGKFLSVDPLSSSFPWNSPYSYAEGDPINFIDLDGLEKPSERVQAVVGTGASTVIKTTTSTTIEKSTELAVNEAGKLVVKKSSSTWVGGLFSKGAGLFVGFLLSSLEAGHGCNCGAGHDLASQCPGSGSYIKPEIQTQPKPEPQPIDPRTQAPPKKDEEDGAHLYKTLDNQKNTGKGGLGIVANDMNNPIPYIGITTSKLIGGNSRYSSLSIRGANSEIIATDKLSTIQGAESAIIALNTYGVNFRSHLGNLKDADVKAGTRIANLVITHKQIQKIRAGIKLLDRVRPGWDKATGTNSLLFSENKKGANNPNP